MRTLWAVIIVFFIISASPAKGDPLFLQLYQPDRDEILMTIPVDQGDCFTLIYIHSSDLTPVTDHFMIEEPGKIILEEEEFQWYGSGLEFLSTPGAEIVLEGGRTRVLLHRPFEYIPIRVGYVAGHHIAIGDLSIPLLRVAEGGERLWIQVVSDNAP